MRHKTLFLAWFSLILLTFVSLGLGEWLRQGTWLYVLVAAVIWFKAWVVARYFLETRLSHTFIRRLTWVFIAFVPVALVLTVTFGREFVEWIKL
jgi:hypothetical protein